jgi:hypothetical protein
MQNATNLTALILLGIGGTDYSVQSWSYPLHGWGNMVWVVPKTRAYRSSLEEPPIRSMSTKTKLSQ